MPHKMDYLVCAITHGNIYSELSSTHLKGCYFPLGPLLSSFFTSPHSPLHSSIFLVRHSSIDNFILLHFPPPFASAYTQRNGYSPSTWFRFPSCSLQQSHHRIDPSRRYWSRSHPCKAPDRHRTYSALSHGEQEELTRIFINLCVVLGCPTSPRVPAQIRCQPAIRVYSSGCRI